MKLRPQFSLRRGLGTVILGAAAVMTAVPASNALAASGEPTSVASGPSPQSFTLPLNAAPATSSTASSTRYAARKFQLNPGNCAAVNKELHNARQAELKNCDVSVRLVETTPRAPALPGSRTPPAWVQAELCLGDPPSWWKHSSISCSQIHIDVSGVFVIINGHVWLQGHVQCGGAATWPWSWQQAWCGPIDNGSSRLGMGQNANVGEPGGSGTAWLRIQIPARNFGQDIYLQGG